MPSAAVRTVSGCTLWISDSRIRGRQSGSNHELSEHAFYTRTELATIGVSEAEIKQACRRRSIVPLGHGAFADAAIFSSLSTEERHILSIRAVTSACGKPVVSHQSAAVLCGLHMWNPDLSRVHLSVDSARGGRRTAKLHVHTNRLRELTVVDGLTATSVAKTTVDLARALSFEAAVCVADSALKSGQATRDEMRAVADASARMAGCARATRVVEFADGRSESVGESRSRVYLQRYGFPAPELQVTLRDPQSHAVVRPDFLIGRVILEFDGRLKYSSRDVLFAEKRREDLLVSLGWVVVRWTWDDLATDAGAIVLKRGLERARGLPPPRTIRL